MCIHIIGGGVISLFSAWYLREAGYDVMVIDQTDLSGGCSYENAGMIVVTGRAMMGISQGPATGKLVAELLTGQALSMDISLLAPDRFQGGFQ